MSEHGLSKKERIVSQKLIDELFTGGQSHSLVAFPLRAVYIVRQSLNMSVATDSPSESVANDTPCDPVAQILISVPKRRFKHAVDRNRVKRQVREAYRHHKPLLLQTVPVGEQLAIAFVWLSDSHLSSPEVDKRMRIILQRIAQKAIPTPCPL